MDKKERPKYNRGYPEIEIILSVGTPGCRLLVVQHDPVTLPGGSEYSYEYDPLSRV
eukprot:CAMPEP_0171887512 /NCGR_PEP_ID=MMETSP0992-20121227/42502_1 /TAXON_ID=483369 /ORGANISM="non described non described, Strain CCMP2098" /LENGTH=55 /DNA_ID=CAMNT_0012514299 /DNA_START=92 /DNA_END=259 /DNA_ORIENTATION=-